MSFSNFLINGFNAANGCYQRNQYEPDEVTAMIPTHRFTGKLEMGNAETGVKWIDGAVAVQSSISTNDRQTNIAFWKGLESQSFLLTLGSFTVLAAGSAVAFTATSTGWMVLGVALAVSGLALTCLGVVRKEEAAKEVTLWSDPVAHAAAMRRNMPTLPIKNILVHVGKFIHIAELREIFFRRAGGMVNSIEIHYNSTQLSSEIVRFVHAFFKDNELECINEVLDDSVEFNGFKLSVNEHYYALKHGYEDLVKQTNEKIRGLNSERDKKIAPHKAKLDRDLAILKRDHRIAEMEQEVGKLPRMITITVGGNPVTQPNPKVAFAERELAAAKALFEKESLPYRKTYEKAIAPINKAADKEVKEAQKELNEALVRHYDGLAGLASDLLQSLAEYRTKQAETQTAVLN